MSLEGKIAIVTGGSRGIGRAITKALCDKGAKVFFSYAGNADAAAETEALCAGNATGIQGDVADPEAVKALFDAAGAVDILVNNAGITRDGLLMTMKDDAFDAVIATNLKGAYLTMKAACRPMMKKRWGRIVNLSSVVGVHGNAGQANYSASKAGVIGLTKSVAKELASRGITANAVAPGFIDTDMTASLPDAAREAMLGSIPAKTLGKPEDVANVVAFLCSDEAGYITGQVIGVDGGMGM